MNKIYLGDGVYLAVAHGQIVLTTEDGVRATNTIYLDPVVAMALWLKLGQLLGRGGGQ